MFFIQWVDAKGLHTETDLSEAAARVRFRKLLENWSIRSIEVKDMQGKVWASMAWGGE